MICTRCLKDKSTAEFFKDKYKKTGYKSWCKECCREYTESYNKSVMGVILSIYHHEKSRKIDLKSYRKKDKVVEYSRKEFIDFMLSSKKFNLLYDRWAENGYENDDKPSVDRIDFNKGYNFDNIQIMTWKENNEKGNIEISKQNNSKARAKSSYKEKSTTRSNFKATCKTMEWSFEDFEEIYSGEKSGSGKKYFYFESKIGGRYVTDNRQCFKHSK